MMANDIDIPVVIDRVLVSSQEKAVKLRCLGSPTIQINGLDIDPFARGSLVFGLAWRRYEASGVPSEDMVKNAILSA